MTTFSALDPNLRTNDETAALLGIKPNTLEIWRSTKGSIIPCSWAMRRIHLSDLMLMAGVLKAVVEK